MLAQNRNVVRFSKVEMSFTIVGYSSYGPPFTIAELAVSKSDTEEKIIEAAKKVIAKSILSSLESVASFSWKKQPLFLAR